MLLAQLHNNRADVHFHLKEFAEAKMDAKRAVELAPHWAKPQMRLTEVSFRMGQYEKAALEPEEALGVATASSDANLLKEIKLKLPEYRQLRSEELRGGNANLAYGPMHSNEGAFRVARQVMQGRSESEDPDEVIKNLLNVVVGSDDEIVVCVKQLLMPTKPCETDA